MTPRMLTLYRDTVVPELEKELKVTNRMAVPRITKVVLNVGAGKAVNDAQHMKTVVDTLTRITGQKPVVTRAKKSISNFKIRKGMGVGAKVTLRGSRMYEFLDKLVNVTLPRVRDFQGISKTAFDKQGNYTLALQEHGVFPEVGDDAIESPHGLEVTIGTTASSPAEGELLLRKLGFPLTT